MEAAQPLPLRTAGPWGTRFALKYALIAGGAFLLYGYPYPKGGSVERGFEAYLGLYARLVGGIIGLLEKDLHVSGTQIIGRFPLQIVKNCDCIEVNILLVAAIVAFPAPWRRRLAAAGIGILILVFANVIRIGSLYYIGLHANQWFHVAHLEIWPLLLIVLAAVLFLLLAQWMVPLAKPAPAPAGGVPPPPSPHPSASDEDENKEKSPANAGGTTGRD